MIRKGTERYISTLDQLKEVIKDFRMRYTVE